MKNNNSVPEVLEVLEGLFGYEKSKIRNLSLVNTGLINQTYVFEHETQKLILQKLNSIFEPAINEDIQFVTAYFKSQNMLTPEILDFKIYKNQVWRILSFIDGRIYSNLNPQKNRNKNKIIFKAGKVVAQWHKALNAQEFKNLNYEFKNTRENKHDLEAKINYLENLLENKKNTAKFNFKKIRKFVLELIIL